MSFLEAVRSIDRQRVLYALLAIVPYLDLETIGIVPVLRDAVPYVDPIYVTELSWTERGRLAVVIVIPYFDGEILELLLGVDLMEVIRD